MSSNVNQILVIEEASLELVPKELRTKKEVIDVQRRFGVKPEAQILDRNFHANAMLSLKGNLEKRGRPDVVHFALLDATSTPLFLEDKIRIIIHTIHNETIELKSGTRPPRTLQRFCGVFSKLLSGQLGSQESNLFDYRSSQTFGELLDSVGAESIFCLTRKGEISDLGNIVSKAVSSSKTTTWIVGGFAHGSFGPDVTARCTRSFSISPMPLPAHVVTARLCYELEKNLLR
jgi:rRNA small subunit pseudouridine methyltransferase Nep1